MLRMKRILYPLFAIVLLLAACQPQPKSAAGDLNAAKDTLAKSIDQMYAAYSSGDTAAYLAYFTDDCLICGTDPGEYWDKPSYVSLIHKQFSDTAFTAPTISISKREIRMEKEGTAALVIQQSIIPEWSEKLPVRSVDHFVMTDGRWLCDFSSIAFTPENKDMGLLFYVLEE